MLLCRLPRKIDDYGVLNHLPFILFVVLTIFWMISFLLIMRSQYLLFGIRMFLWRCCCLRVVCFMIGSLPRTTFIGVESLTLMLKLVSEGVGWWKHLLTYFYIVICLALFRIIFIGGLVYLQSCLLMWLIILSSSILLVVLLRWRVQSYKSSGLQQRGKYGKKEIIEFLMQMNAQSCMWWIRLSR